MTTNPNIKHKAFHDTYQRLGAPLSRGDVWWELNPSSDRTKISESIGEIDSVKKFEEMIYPNEKARASFLEWHENRLEKPNRSTSSVSRTIKQDPSDSYFVWQSWKKHGVSFRRQIQKNRKLRDSKALKSTR